MHKKNFLFVIIISLIFFRIGLLHAKIDNITIAIENNDFPPYTFGNKSKHKGKGVLVNLLKSFENDIQVKFKFINVPWKRALTLLGQNKIDGVFNASFKTSRMKIGVYPFKNGKVDNSRGTHSSNYILYKRKNSYLEWNGVKFSNAKRKIAVERGFSIKTDLEKMGVRVREVQSSKHGFVMIQKKRLDGMVTLEDMGDLTIEQNPFLKTDIEKESIPVKSKRYFLIFSHDLIKKNLSLANKIWDEINRANKSGKLKLFYKKWVNENK